jgi:deazaflavin-dependent oxidoreductase (nitroreductase family)
MMDTARPAPPKIPPFMKFANRLAAWMAARGVGAMGKQLLVLETRGRRSGKIYKTPLGALEQDGGLYVIATRGPQTDWYQNARAADRVQVSRAGQRRPMRAVPVTAADQKQALIAAYIQRFPQVSAQLARATGTEDAAEQARRVEILRLEA